MRGIYTERNTAQVINYKALGNRPDEALVRVAMGKNWRGISASHTPIALSVGAACPEPTAIPSSRMIDSRPEESESKFWGVATHSDGIAVMSPGEKLGSKLMGHLRLVLSGVARTVAETTRPPNYTRSIASPGWLSVPTTRKGYFYA